MLKYRPSMIAAAALHLALSMDSDCDEAWVSPFLCALTMIRRATERLG